MTVCRVPYRSFYRYDNGKPLKLREAYLDCEHFNFIDCTCSLLTPGAVSLIMDLSWILFYSSWFTKSRGTTRKQATLCHTPQRFKLQVQAGLEAFLSYINGRIIKQVFMMSANYFVDKQQSAPMTVRASREKSLAITSDEVNTVHLYGTRPRLLKLIFSRFQN